LKGRSDCAAVRPYVADFFCHAGGLVIEIDGGHHFEPGHERRDARRDAFLAAKGYRVLHFTNHDVLTNREGVLETIANAIEHAPSPTLPRKRRRAAHDGREAGR
jgi:very-short-patch-repair endonuclease